MSCIESLKQFNKDNGCESLFDIAKNQDNESLLQLYDDSLLDAPVAYRLLPISFCEDVLDNIKNNKSYYNLYNYVYDSRILTLKNTLSLKCLLNVFEKSVDLNLIQSENSEELIQTQINKYNRLYEKYLELDKCASIMYKENNEDNSVEHIYKNIKQYGIANKNPPSTLLKILKLKYPHLFEEVNNNEDKEINSQLIYNFYFKYVKEIITYRLNKNGFFNEIYKLILTINKNKEIKKKILHKCKKQKNQNCDVLFRNKILKYYLKPQKLYS